MPPTVGALADDSAGQLAVLGFPGIPAPLRIAVALAGAVAAFTVSRTARRTADDLG
ncbi:hypothetical protein AB0H36_34215 [Kribbella sp. NPDC050820]|uniref:hypothetical protein n=1 Tax=Kribbella sp. NPDC050820 TaxID=3155408 RepID=UPI0033F633F6